MITIGYYCLLSHLFVDFICYQFHFSFASLLNKYINITWVNVQEHVSVGKSLAFFWSKCVFKDKDLHPRKWTVMVMSVIKKKDWIVNCPFLYFPQSYRLCHEICRLTIQYMMMFVFKLSSLTHHYFDFMNIILIIYLSGASWNGIDTVKTTKDCRLQRIWSTLISSRTNMTILTVHFAYPVLNLF